MSTTTLTYPDVIRVRRALAIGPIAVLFVISLALIANTILVLVLSMTQDASNKDIAEKLVISGKTVSNHISNIFSKLQVADWAQAIIRARDAGLG